MSEPIKAWAIKHPTSADPVFVHTISKDEKQCWRKMIGYNEAVTLSDLIELVTADGYRAVRVEIREVEE